MPYGAIMMLLKSVYMVMLCAAAGGLLFMATKLHGLEPVVETAAAMNMLYLAVHVVKKKSANS